MASPFAGLAENATLKFTIATGALVEDPITLNQNPVLKTVTCTAFLKVDSRPRSVLEQFYPGLDQFDNPLAGYLVNPMLLPKGISNKAVAQATIGDRVGIFVLCLPVQSPFQLVTDILGHKIFGTFREQV